MPINAQFTGRLTQDPELHELPDGGDPVATIRLAVDGLGRRGTTGYVTVVSYGAAGKAAAEHLHTGRLVEVVGRFEHSEWTAQEGGRRERLQVIGHVRFLNGAGSKEPADQPELEPNAEPAAEPNEKPKRSSRRRTRTQDSQQS
jgi:single stranded DNA-binding protein